MPAAPRKLLTDVGDTAHSPAMTSISMDFSDVALNGGDGGVCWSYTDHFFLPLD
jgi:hypothetical protein